MAATQRFYTEILGMRAESFETADSETWHALFFGDMKINLHRAGAEFEPKAQEARPGTADLCFLTATDLQTWQEHLCARGVKILEGPVPRTGATGALRSLYVRDPDGNLIEIGSPG
jgi:catechol 2,3-dioxygenase-like lactoylglutathione lyase family enzyme